MALFSTHRVTAPTEPAGDAAGEDAVQASATTPEGPTVPRQRRDAYTLYAEVYALRLDLDDDVTDPL